MTIITSGFGRPALEALVAAVQAAKAGDPLAAVQVVVPNEPVGITARRWLARHGNVGAPGTAGVTVVTLYRLAETIAAPVMAGSGRRPATTPVVVGAMRGALARSPGLFADVADHPQTAQALAAASRELRTVDPTSWPQLVRNRPVTADVIRLHRTVSEDLEAAYYDEAELQTLATTLLADMELAPAVLFLPSVLTPQAQRFVAALRVAGEVTAVVGVTGTPADRRVLESVAAAWGEPSPPLAAVVEPLGDRVMCSTDADDEVRAVVSLVADELGAGVPGHRIAVVYGSSVPYARLLHEQFTDAGIECYGRGVKPAAERVYGRAVRGLLGLPDRDFRRADVMAWLADAPVAGASSQRWDSISRTAGVVAGPDWSTRLNTYQQSRRQRAEQWDHDSEPDRAEWARADADAAAHLQAFIAELRADLDAVAAAGDWTSLSQRLSTLWTRLFPPARQHGDDVGGHDRVSALLRGLRGLESVAGAPSLASAREIIELALHNDLQRVGDIGPGAMVGPVADAVGQEFDLLCVVGMAEGAMPPTGSDDPLLPEPVRELTAGVLPTWRDRQDGMHRDLLAALAGAGQRVLTFPRGDLRSGSMRVPSRWLLPTLRRYLGDVQATDWQKRSHDQVVVRASYDAGIRSGEPVTADQYQQREALADPSSVDPVAVQMQRDRTQGDLTRFTGVVGSDPPLPPVGSSPTALQTWVRCPHHYFTRYVLRVRELDDPDETIEMSAIDQGTLMHKVLQRLVEEWHDPDFGQPWPPELVTRLDVLIDEELDTAQRTGMVGLRNPWARIRRRLRRDLRDWINHDNTVRSGRWKPLHTEMAFDDLRVDLPAGGHIVLRGSIDRVDIDADGNYRVLDYKSGSDYSYTKLSPADPTFGGRYLQLPLYALAAGRGPQPTRADYWFISRAGGGRLVGYDVTDDIVAATTQVVAVAVAGHQAGLFPPRPTAHSDGYDCPSCEVDGQVERMSADTFTALLADPRLADYRQVIG